MEPDTLSTFEYFKIVQVKDHKIHQDRTATKSFFRT